MMNMVVPVVNNLMLDTSKEESNMMVPRFIL